MGVDIKNKETNIRESMEIVKADFDQIGSLVENKAISVLPVKGLMN
jgi:hypothetical protein